MNERCIFGSGRAYCSVLPDDSGMCPRHAFLVATLGKDKAEIEELGVECPVCLEGVPAATVAKCPACGRDDVCAGCRKDGGCCDEDMEFEDESEWTDEEATA